MIYPASDGNMSSLPLDVWDFVTELCRAMMDPKEPDNRQDVVNTCHEYTNDTVQDKIVLPIPEIEMISAASKTTLVVMYVTTIFLAVLGNGTVLLVFLWKKANRSIISIFIVSLAVSDILIAVLCMPFNLGTALSTFWKFGSFGCKMVPTVQNLCVVTTSLTLCGIALDRYYAILYPLKSKFIHTEARALRILLLIWLVSLLSSIPHALTFNLRTMTIAIRQGNGTNFTTGIILQEKMCMWELQVWRTILIWLMFLLIFAFPVVLMTVAYARIAQQLWGRKMIGVQYGRVMTDCRERSKRRPVVMMVLVVILYTICWGPLLIFNVISQHHRLPPTEAIMNTRFYLQWLAMSNSALNPIVYSFLHDNFRNNFRSTCACFFVKSRVGPAIVVVQPEAAPQTKSTGSQSGQLTVNYKNSLPAQL